MEIHLLLQLKHSSKKESLVIFQQVLNLVQILLSSHILLHVDQVIYAGKEDSFVPKRHNLTSLSHHLLFPVFFVGRPVLSE